MAFDSGVEKDGQMNNHGYAKSTGCNIMQNMCPEVEAEV